MPEPYATRTSEVAAEDPPGVINYDEKMVSAFLAPRPEEAVPAQYAHALASMAAREHAEVVRLRAVIAATREYVTSLGDAWEECTGGRDGIRRWEECPYCRASRNDTRNGSSHDDGTHRKWCPSVEILALLNTEPGGGQ